MNLILKSQQVSEIKFESHPKSDAPFNVEARYGFDVAYNGDRSECTATFQQEGRAVGAPEQFYFEVTMQGFFTCEGILTDEDKRDAHVLAYQLLFPHMQAFVRTLTTQSGMAPLMLASAPPKKENIQFAKAGQ